MQQGASAVPEIPSEIISVCPVFKNMKGVLKILWISQTKIMGLNIKYETKPSLEALLWVSGSSTPIFCE